ncbi:unannotated protein [freshwater metagenome]|uniref:Unannotated protein n=1 Tax=freshwater metagenome TaxID=449393 RepID=A0A6J6FZB8_9ZZZZ
MKRHKRMVLQQRIRTWTVETRWRGETLKRIGWSNHHPEEEDANDKNRENRPTNKRISKTLTELQHHRHQIAAEDQRPKNDRSFKSPPQRCKVVERRGFRRTVIGDVQHREVTGDECSFHRNRSEEPPEEDQPRIPTRQPHKFGTMTDQSVTNRDGTKNRRSKTKSDSCTSKCEIHEPLRTVVTGTFPFTSAWLRRSASSSL